MKPAISVVVPVFNEENNIPVLHPRLKKALQSVSKNYEVIYINDGSTDKSLKILKQINKKNKNTKIISFSRNFGHMPAIMAGLTLCKGKKVIIMDADLQDPPEVIPKLYQKSLEGFEVVYGIKKNRKEGSIKNLMFTTFYRLLNNVATFKMPLDAGTFSIIDRKVVDLMLQMPERNKYFSGLRAWTGFPQTGVEYSRGKRYKGKPASFARLIKLALDGIISFSHIPLRLASILGFIFASLAFVFIIIVAIGRLLFGLGIVGWASTMSTILLIGGIQLITLGIIGEYLARIYDEVKRRPEYIISEKIGF